MNADRRKAIENEVMDIIAQQITEGYYYGTFDYDTGNDGEEYISVDWVLRVGIDFKED